MSNLAIIPCKGHSKRVEGKNTKEFCGLPLFMHTVNQARDCGLFDEVLLSTESEDVSHIAEEYGLHVPFLRPYENTLDTVTLGEIVEEILKKYESAGKHFETVCVLLVTAPLRLPEDISESYKLLTNDVDGVVSVTEYDKPICHALKMDERGVISMREPEYNDVIEAHHPKFYVDNASILIAKVSSFAKSKNFFTGNVVGYFMPISRSVDINTQEDWALAEYYMRQQAVD